MGFTGVNPFFLMGWNTFFYWTVIFSLLAAVIAVGIPFVRSIPFLPKSVKVDQMRLQKFFGRITPYALVLLTALVLVFIFESAYSIAVYLQMAANHTSDATKINGVAAYVVGLVISVLFVFVSARWLRRQWRESERDTLPPSEAQDLRLAISALTVKLDKLDKLDRLDKFGRQLDRLSTAIEEMNRRNRPKGK